MKNYKEIFISPAKDGFGIECLADGETHYLCRCPITICYWVQVHSVQSATHSYCMEFATEYGFKNNDDALELWNKAWDRYLNKLETRKANAVAVKTFSNLQTNYSPYGVS